MQRSFCSPPMSCAKPSQTSLPQLPAPRPAAKVQRRPQKLAAPAEPQQPSQTVPCASHANLSRPNPSHPQATKNVLHVYRTLYATSQAKLLSSHARHATAVPLSCHSPSHQPCHCCARAEAKGEDPMFLPLCEQPCSSASRCPQGSMEPYAWPHTHWNTNHHRQSLQSHRPGQTARHTQMF